MDREHPVDLEPVDLEPGDLFSTYQTLSFSNTEHRRPITNKVAMFLRVATDRDKIEFNCNDHRTFAWFLCDGEIHMFVLCYANFEKWLKPL